jgi:trehalose-phosphatase
MTVLAHQDVCSQFFERVHRAAERVLLLDYDGTLAPFTPDRMHALPYREIPEMVSRIMRCHTRVVLISGRPATELLFLSGIHPHPEIWGSHGLERLCPDGSYQMEALPERQQRALQIADRSLHAAGLASRIETKPGSIAVHWRGLSQQEMANVESKARLACVPLTREYGMELLPFDGGVELRVPGKNKGDAVAAILAECHPGFAAAYLGDDQTDENAFRAIKGQGLAILVRPQARPSVADMWLRPPEELMGFLRDWLLACGAEA